MFPHVVVSVVVIFLSQNRARYKSLISFGEVLDPASKAAVLSVDSQVQMRGMIDSELQVRDSVDTLSTSVPVDWTGGHAPPVD